MCDLDIVYATSDPVLHNLVLISVENAAWAKCQ